MRKFINISFIALLSTLVVGCYNDFGTPDVAAPYTDADFTDCEHISIAQLKSQYSSLVGTSLNSLITNNWVISGKVISSDESGNLYKSLYIQDADSDYGTAAIELRLFSGNFLSYPIGSTLYVKLEGLSIGDYAGMISIGAYSLQEDTDYPHTTIEGSVMLAEHIFLGESGEITQEDILVVDSSNYQTLSSSDLGRLICFEGLESVFGTSNFGYCNYYPNYFSSSTANFSWSTDLQYIDPSWATPPMAYYGVDPTSSSTSTTSNYYYGSAWYTYDSSSSESAPHFIVRLSSYASFASRAIPTSGTMVNITAILTQFISGSYTTYQIVPSFSDDIVEL